MGFLMLTVVLKWDSLHLTVHRAYIISNCGHKETLFGFANLLLREGIISVQMINEYKWRWENDLHFVFQTSNNERNWALNVKSSDSKFQALFFFNQVLLPMEKMLERYEILPLVLMVLAVLIWIDNYFFKNLLPGLGWTLREWTHFVIVWA